MSIKRTLQVFALVVIICSWNALGDEFMWIESVDIVPLQPTETDEIIFDISGWANQYPSWVEYDEFSQDVTSLQLDLYVNKSYGYGFSEWTYSKQISTLPVNTYTLEINAFDYQDNILRDTYLFEFTVVPEPSSIVFLSFGLCLLSKFPKRSKK